MESTDSIHPQYRRDVDGLRGLLILAVVGFHGFPKSVPGGYIGVSVFFVISGYLISTIIFKSLDRGTFDFVDFYIRRMRRIFPSLIVCLTAAFSIGWFSLLPDEFKELGKYIVGGAAFADNFVAWQESDYFAREAELRPLLHLWSLSIEEQFYLLWPLTLWLGFRAKINLMALVVVLVVASFLFNVHGIAHDKAATFYAPWCRFWEILSGGVLAYLHRGTRPDGWWACFTVRVRTELPFTRVITVMQARNVCACLGLVILLVGFFSLNRQTPFPGWFALIPVGGALLLIGSGPSAWVNRRLLSHPAIVWFGLISYPLYLWHWVLLSYTRIIEGGEPSTLIKTGAIAISILASWATFQLIENPIRFGQFRRPQTA